MHHFTFFLLFEGMTKSSVSLFFTVTCKVENFDPFQDFQGPQPKFKDFPGPRTSFANSRTFQDFQGQWQP